MIGNKGGVTRGGREGAIKHSFEIFRIGIQIYVDVNLNPTSLIAFFRRKSSDEKKTKKDEKRRKRTKKTEKDAETCGGPTHLSLRASLSHAVLFIKHPVYKRN